MFSLSQSSAASNIDNGESGDYVFEVEAVSDGSAVMSSMSDNSITMTDRTELRIISKIKAHKNTINRIEASTMSPHLLFSCSDDKKAYGWDTRCFDKPVMHITHQEEVTAISAGVNGTLLATACGTSIYFYDIRAFNGTSSTVQQPGKLGVYSDAHSDMITQLKFHPEKSHILTSAAEDGLICSYNTSVSAEEDAVMSVLNTECPVSRFGYFGVGNEGIYSLSTVETLSFWHFPSAQRVSHFPSIREELASDYLVDCFCAPNTNEVYLLAGDFRGEGVIAQIQPNRFNVVGGLATGHTSSIRCCSAIFTTGASIDGLELVTGGEDSRLCKWRVNSSTAGPSQQVSSVAPSHTHQHQQSLGSIKGKKDSSKMRFKPY